MILLRGVAPVSDVTVPMQRRPRCINPVKAELQALPIRKRKVKPLPDTDYLRTRLAYDPETGFVTRLVGRRRGKRAEGGLSTEGKFGFWIKLDGEGYVAARVIWKLVTGNDPEDLIDHEDRNPRNNKWNNLRLADSSTNAMNRVMPPRASGHPRGVYAYGKGWIVKITVNRVQQEFYRGYDYDEACRIAEVSYQSLHKEFYCPQKHEPGTSTFKQPPGRPKLDIPSKLMIMELNSTPEPNTGCRIWLGEVRNCGPFGSGLGDIRRWLCSEVVDIGLVKGETIPGVACNHPWCVELSHLIPVKNRSGAPGVRSTEGAERHRQAMKASWARKSEKDRASHLSALHQGMLKKWEEQSPEERSERFTGRKRSASGTYEAPD